MNSVVILINVIAVRIFTLVTILVETGTVHSVKGIKEKNGSLPEKMSFSQSLISMSYSHYLMNSTHMRSIILSSSTLPYSKLLGTP